MSPTHSTSKAAPDQKKMEILKYIVNLLDISKSLEGLSDQEFSQ